MTPSPRRVASRFLALGWRVNYGNGQVSETLRSRGAAERELKDLRRRGLDRAGAFIEFQEPETLDWFPASHLRRASDDAYELVESYARRNRGEVLSTDKMDYKLAVEFPDETAAENFAWEAARAARSRGLHLSFEEPEPHRGAAGPSPSTSDPVCGRTKTALRGDPRYRPPQTPGDPADVDNPRDHTGWYAERRKCLISLDFAVAQ